MHHDRWTLASLDLLPGDEESLMQENWPAWRKLVRFMQAWLAALQLNSYLKEMGIPQVRRNVAEIRHLLWLHRNLGIGYSQHVHYEAAKRLTTYLLHDSLFMELDILPWEMHTWSEHS